MGKITLFVFLAAQSFHVMAQQLDDKTYDFWIGNWEVSWTAANGKTVQGENNIVRILGDKVIQENFKDPSSNYTGMSLSMYNPKTKTWHQTWMDSGGGHFNFTGGFVEGNPSFQTLQLQKGDQIIQQRMVFKHIKEDSFLWIWEGTKNGGKLWTELWRINYRRKEK